MPIGNFIFLKTSLYSKPKHTCPYTKDRPNTTRFLTARNNKYGRIKSLIVFCSSDDFVYNHLL